MDLHFSDFPYRRLKQEEIEKQADNALAALKLTNSASAQIKILTDWDIQLKEWDSYASIAYVHFSQNTLDKHSQEEREFYDNIRPFLLGQEQRFIKAILTSPHREKFEENFGSNLFKTWELSLRAFDPKIEEEKKNESKIVAEYSSLNAQSKIHFRGKEYSFSEMAPFYVSADRQTRLEARKAQATTLEKNQDQFDDLYDQLVHLRHNMAIKMGYPSYIELGYAEMKRVDYNDSHVAEFRRQIKEDLLPITQRIISDRAQRINLSDYAFHDEGLMDLKGKIEPKGDHDWMMDRAQEMFNSMGEDFGEFFTMLRSRGLMDLKTREGKVGGGFCTLFTDHGAPFIFANFNGTQGDVRVFTHECGHAFQAFQSRNLPLRDMIWPTYEAAEIHSMSLEFLSYPWMKNFFKEDTDRFKQSHLESSLLFIPYGAAVDEFQHMVYSNPNASPQERTKMWKEVENTYLPHRKYVELPYFSSGRFWQRQGHIYKRPFYYIDYCLAQVCALQFWGLAEENRAEAMKRYRYLCSLGGSLPFTQLLKKVGINNPFVKGTLSSAISNPLNELGFSV